MRLHHHTELSELALEIEQLSIPHQRCAYNQVKFAAIKEKILAIVREVYGETSREFRVIRLTASPVTVIKVIDHIVSRTQPTPNTKVVNM